MVDYEGVAVAIGLVLAVVALVWWLNSSRNKQLETLCQERDWQFDPTKHADPPDSLADAVLLLAPVSSPVPPKYVRYVRGSDLGAQFCAVEQTDRRGGSGKGSVEPRSVLAISRSKDAKPLPPIRLTRTSAMVGGLQAISDALSGNEFSELPISADCPGWRITGTKESAAYFSADPSPNLADWLANFSGDEFHIFGAVGQIVAVASNNVLTPSLLESLLKDAHELNAMLVR